MKIEYLSIGSEVLSFFLVSSEFIGSKTIKNWAEGLKHWFEIRSQKISQSYEISARIWAFNDTRNVSVFFIMLVTSIVVASYTIDSYGRKPFLSTDGDHFWQSRDFWGWALQFLGTVIPAVTFMWTWFKETPPRASRAAISYYLAFFPLASMFLWKYWFDVKGVRLVCLSLSTGAGFFSIALLFLYIRFFEVLLLRNAIPKILKQLADNETLRRDLFVVGVILFLTSKTLAFVLAYCHD